MKIVTIDTGTTNTRVKLWQNQKVVASGFCEVGVRDTAITGNKRRLQQGVKLALEQALAEGGLRKHDIDLLLASGMITSSIGLHEVPHVRAPAGIKELAEGMVKAVIEEVSEQPIWFLPGVKNNVREVTLENCEAMDIMRGEEAEVLGIVSRLKLEGPILFILPGSHSKFINLNEKNQITGCLTTLAGELMSVVTKSTILADALEGTFPKKENEEMIIEGARYARKVSLNRVCFTVRILDLFTKLSPDEKANFLAGAIFSADLQAIKNSLALNIKPGTPIVIGGSKMLKRIFEILVKNDEYFKNDVKLIEDEEMQYMAGWGVINAAREKGLLKY